MFSSFRIQNFRCFRDLALDDLERINLIAGKNNVGKTAVLEAMHLHCHPGNARLWAKVAKLRGLADPLKEFAEVGTSLFRNWNSSVPIDVGSTHSIGVSRSTRLSLVDAAESRRRFPELEGNLAKTSRKVTDGPRLVLESEEPDAGMFETSISDGVSLAVDVPSPWVMNNVFIAAAWKDRHRDERYFGELKVEKKVEQLIGALKVIEPDLRELSLAPFGGELWVHGDVGLPRLVPVPLMGEGFGRLLSIVLAIHKNAGGAVFIDEIENGLHYSVLKPMWTGVAEAARTADVQVFASTHSFECIQAAHDAFEENSPYEFSYFRLDRKDGEIVARRMDRRMLEVVNQSDLEIR